MRKELLQKFIEEHPNHPLTPYFIELVNSELTSYNLIRDVIQAAIKEQKLTPAEINQADILLANASLIKE